MTTARPRPTISRSIAMDLHSAGLPMRTLALLIATLATALCLSVRGAEFPDAVDVTPLRGIPVQHDGRYMPLDTLARDMVTKVAGTAYLAGHDPVLVYLGWVFDSGTWREAPIVPIHSKALRDAIGLSTVQKEFSFADLVSHDNFHSLVGAAQDGSGDTKADELQKQVLKIRDRLVTLQDAFGGTSLRIVPQPEDAVAAWGSVAIMLQSQDKGLQAARDAWMALGGAYVANDPQGFADAAARLKSALGALPAAYRPSPHALAREIRYNRLHPYRNAWMVLTLATLLAAFALKLRKRWFDLTAAGVTLLGFGIFTYGLSLRWAIAGRIPASNMFESLLFLSWGAAAFAFIAFFVLRGRRTVPLTAVAIGALALCLADSLPLDHFVRPVAPVLLDTFWMSVHVPVIMISYAVLAIAVLIAHIQVVAVAILPRDRPVVSLLDRYLYGYMLSGSLLLLIGIVTGSMWAASSWGRYWGWDPKEVWSLVALLGYMTIIHVRRDQRKHPRWMLPVTAVAMLAVFGLVAVGLAPMTLGKVLSLVVVAIAVVYFLLARSMFATAAKSILAFWLIIMTYVGVNYVLGTGLHSYGFGMGAVASRMCEIGALDLAVLLVFLVVYILRHRSPKPAEA